MIKVELLQVDKAFIQGEHVSCHSQHNRTLTESRVAEFELDRRQRLHVMGRRYIYLFCPFFITFSYTFFAEGTG